MQTPCTHPPARLFAWFAYNGVGRGIHDRTTSAWPAAIVATC